jgi:dihydroxy-acid dehydratase
LTTSGSTNAVLHLSAIAYEAELDMCVIDLFEKLDKKTPVTVKVNPSSKYDMNDFNNAGGIPRVMSNLKSLLHQDVMTVTGRTLAENLKEYKFKFPAESNVIRTIDNCFSAIGGLTILRGNLAPNSGISKPGAIDSSVHHFTGTAKTFDCEEDAEHAILAGEIQEGTVIVIRYEGPKGGPGMREMYKAMKYLNGMGLAKSTAIVTDGRFSGTNNGCFVGHISPEAAEGGPIAIVKDGDRIDIDVVKGTVNLLVADSEIRDRLNNWKPQKAKFNRGYLAIYSRLVSSADEGAIVRY